MVWAPSFWGDSQKFKKLTSAFLARLKLDINKSVSEVRVPGLPNLVLGIIFFLAGDRLMATITVLGFVAFWDDITW
jgi:hypothetical protein